MDVSSDSQDTIILSNENQPSDSEIEDILKKYIPTTSTTTTSNNCQEYLYERLSQSKNSVNKNESSDNDEFESLNTNDGKSSFDVIIDTKLGDPSDGTPKLQKGNIKEKPERMGKRKEKTQRLKDIQTRKVEKSIERERKREMLAKQKSMKDSLRNAWKSCKPDECMKYLVLEVDSKITENGYGAFLMEGLRKSEVSLKTKMQILPNLVSWSRMVQVLDGTLLKNSEASENHFLLIMDSIEFMRYVNKDTLTVYIQNVFSLTRCKQLTVVVVGMENSRFSKEIAVMEVQMSTNSYFRFLKEADGLVDLVLEITKAVAQIPYKLKKEDKYKLHNEYFNDSNKDTVRIDKDGNGLGRLWGQMLTMFPLARLETAEGITAAYPTPSALFRAYESHESKKEDLLQDLSVRRTKGPCTLSRRIGPELSRKCCNFFCATKNSYL